MNTTEWNHTQAAVGHLKVRYSGSPADMNPTALRLRVERLVSGVDLHPAGLPPGAVLVVRKLHNLAPLSVSALSRSTQPDWAGKLRSQMASLYSTAARPALGPVAPSATSVLF